MIEVKGTNISMVRGDSATIIVSTDQYKFQDGDLIEITMRRAPEDPEVAMHIEVDSFVNGKAYIEIKPEDTSGLAFGKYAYDVQLTTAEGLVTTIVENSIFTLRKEVTYGFH